jgi:hypothetical protein
MSTTATRATLRNQARANRDQRRRAGFAARYAAADTPSLRVGHTADHLRAVLADLPPAVAERIADQAVTALNQSIEIAYREEKRA